MDQDFLNHLEAELAGLKEQGLFKAERVLSSPQDGVIRAVLPSGDEREVLNFCANNYLGLANHPGLIESAKAALDRYGYGMASVRFICGTSTLHKELEATLSSFLGTDDTILYSSCFDANGGLFETILGEEDGIVSDALNHASIIDGVRLSKAKRYRYRNDDLEDLEVQLKQARADGCKRILIATDGVFSMDGIIARLGPICDLADRYGAMTMVDDSHAVGFVGDGGKGTPEHCEVMGRIDIITGTLGKALGGASGGYTSGRRPVIDWLRQRSRPYLFSNSLAPMIAATSIACIDLLEREPGLRTRLRDNSTRFRAGMSAAGFTLAGAGHPIIPVMIGDAKVASEMAARLLDEGIYVIGFSFPVVPKDKARIRTQMSAAHTLELVDRAIEAFTTVKRAMGLVA